jgi:hypothetical protein
MSMGPYVESDQPVARGDRESVADGLQALPTAIQSWRDVSEVLTALVIRQLGNLKTTL